MGPNVKFLLTLLGALAVIFVMVKVCGSTFVRNIFVVVGFLATGVATYSHASCFKPLNPMNLGGDRSFWAAVGRGPLGTFFFADRRARFLADFCIYVGATSLLAYLAAAAVGLVAAAAAVALFAAPVFIFFIFASEPAEDMSWAYGAAFFDVLMVLGTFVVACVAFLFAIYLNK